jgi:hypothetical protein
VLTKRGYGAPLRQTQSFAENGTLPSMGSTPMDGFSHIVLNTSYTFHPLFSGLRYHKSRENRFFATKIKFFKKKRALPHQNGKAPKSSAGGLHCK